MVTVWPENGNPVYPFLSSVDNGWFAAALMVVRNAEPGVADLANALLDKMNFGMYFNKDARPGTAGLLRGGFWDAQPNVGFTMGNYLGIGPDVYYTNNHYDILVSEPRIATYIGIAHGQIPPEAYYSTMRTFPDDWNWQEMKPVGGQTGAWVGQGDHRGPGVTGPTLNRAAVDPARMLRQRHRRRRCHGRACARRGRMGRRDARSGETNSGDCHASQDLASGGSGHGTVELNSFSHVNSLTYQWSHPIGDLT